MPEPEVLLSGLGIPESPRWHDGRLWFANWIGQQIVAVAPDGTAEFRPTPAEQQMGWSIDWLADGRLLTTGDKLRRQEPDGHWVTLADQAANEIVVDGRGNTYINGAKLNFDPVTGWAPEPGWIELVMPDGQRRRVADEIQFPNGMIITPDNRTLIISESFAGRLTAFDIDPDGGLSGRRVFADGIGPDGICLDDNGAGLGWQWWVRGSPGGCGWPGPAARRTGREPGSVRAGAGRRGPADTVHPHRRVAAGRRRRREPPPAGQRPAHRGDPGPPGLSPRCRPLTKALTSRTASTPATRA
jgi:sugar lactone lactonase YvrE